MQNFKKMCADVAEGLRRIGANAITVCDTLRQPGADLKGSIDLLTGMTKECNTAAETLMTAAKSIPDPDDMTAPGYHPHKPAQPHKPKHPDVPDNPPHPDVPVPPVHPFNPAPPFDPARPLSPNDPNRPSDPNKPNVP